MYIDKLDDIVHEYNNTYHTAVDVMSRRYIDFGIENNDKDLKFKVDDHVKISKYKNIFAKAYGSNWSGGVFMIKKLKMLFVGIYNRRP